MTGERGSGRTWLILGGLGVWALWLCSTDVWALRYDCNEALCGPIVSKCMLLKSCNCSITPTEIKNRNCTCCKDCVRCLGEQYQDCCSCVGLCKPKPLDPSLKMKSFIEDLEPEEEERELFKTVTEGESSEYQNVFSVYAFPTTSEFRLQQAALKNVTSDSVLLDVLKEHDNDTCTVIFMHQCVPFDKCRQYCGSMGATHCRWFHTGCCECVGEICINYGSKKNMCSKCNEPGEEEVPKNEL